MFLADPSLLEANLKATTNIPFRPQHLLGYVVVRGTDCIPNVCGAGEHTTLNVISSVEEWSRDRATLSQLLHSYLLSLKKRGFVEQRRSSAGRETAPANRLDVNDWLSVFRFSAKQFVATVSTDFGHESLLATASELPVSQTGRSCKMPTRSS